MMGNRALRMGYLRFTKSLPSAFFWSEHFFFCTDCTRKAMNSQMQISSSFKGSR